MNWWDGTGTMCVIHPGGRGPCARKAIHRLVFLNPHMGTWPVCDECLHEFEGVQLCGAP